MLRVLAGLVCRLTGWKVQGRPPDAAKFVVLAAPHTSNWDAWWGLVASHASGVRLSWLCKAELFRGPLGRILTWFGAIPVDRLAGYDTALRVVEAFRQRPRMVLAVTPEGTRGRTDSWRLGFYYIALRAGVPIVPCYVDYRRKVMGIGAACWPSGDIRKDLEAFRSFYSRVCARYPEKVSAIQLASDVPRG